MAQHVRRGLVESGAILLYHAHDLSESLRAYILARSGATCVEAVGGYRRLVEVVDELTFLFQTGDFAKLTGSIQRYGGRTDLLESSDKSALFACADGLWNLCT
jgi:hypothetical protein